QLRPQRVVEILWRNHCLRRIQPGQQFPPRRLRVGPPYLHQRRPGRYILVLHTYLSLFSSGSLPGTTRPSVTPSTTVSEATLTPDSEAEGGARAEEGGDA